MAKNQNNNAVLIRPTSEKLRELLELLNITVVYYVDDENNLSDFDVQIVVGEIQKIYDSERETELEEIQLENWDRNLPREGVVDSLIEQWSLIGFENKIDLYRKILNISNGEDLQLDFKRAELVAKQIPSEMVKVLSPSEWDSEKTKILSILKEGEKALILFDEELKFAGGRFLSDKGQDLIVEVKKMNAGDKLICTLLTHKISSAKEELNFRNEIINERIDKDLDVNDFFPLTKQRLDDAEVFADGIKKVLINNYFEIIKKHTLEIITSSYRAASKKINDFDTYDFDATILKSSVKDGVWAPETIIRISDIVFESELKKSMVATDYVLKVNSEIKSSQKLSGIDFIIPENMQPYSDKLVLRHQEMYDSGDLINALRKPLENGDIFKIGDAQYILVAQACDMVVRKKGDQIGLRTAKVATLLKINDLTSDKLIKEEKKTGDYFRDKYALHYFKSGSKDKGIVDFRDYLIVDIDFLDLCVFNKEGACRINLHKLEDKRYLSKMWESRYDILIEKIRKFEREVFRVRNYSKPNFMGRTIRKTIPRKFQKYFESTKRMNSSMIEEKFYPRFILASTSPADNLVKMEKDDSFSFSAERIKKYKNDGASYLLEKYTRYLSRIAEPHDFAE